MTGVGSTAENEIASTSMRWPVLLRSRLVAWTPKSEMSGGCPDHALLIHGRLSLFDDRHCSQSDPRFLANHLSCLVLDQADSGLCIPWLWRLLPFPRGSEHSSGYFFWATEVCRNGTQIVFSGYSTCTGPWQWGLGGWRWGVEMLCFLALLEDRVHAHYLKGWSEIFSLKLKCRSKDHLKTL